MSHYKNVGQTTKYKCLISPLKMWRMTVTKISFMQKLREDEIQGILATSQLLSKLEKVMEFWIELYKKEM